MKIQNIKDLQDFAKILQESLKDEKRDVPLSKEQEYFFKKLLKNLSKHLKEIDKAADKVANGNSEQVNLERMEELAREFVIVGCASKLPMEQLDQFARAVEMDVEKLEKFSKISGLNPLWAAVAGNRSREDLRLITDSGFAIDQANKEDNHVGHFAAALKVGQKAMETLLDHVKEVGEENANKRLFIRFIKAKNDDKMTMLDIASTKDDHKMVKFLIGAGLEFVLFSKEAKAGERKKGRASFENRDKEEDKNEEKGSEFESKTELEKKSEAQKIEKENSGSEREANLKNKPELTESAKVKSAADESDIGKIKQESESVKAKEAELVKAMIEQAEKIRILQSELKKGTHFSANQIEETREKAQNLLVELEGRDGLKTELYELVALLRKQTEELKQVGDPINGVQGNSIGTEEERQEVMKFRGKNQKEDDDDRDDDGETNAVQDMFQGARLLGNLLSLLLEVSTEGTSEKAIGIADNLLEFLDRLDETLNEDERPKQAKKSVAIKAPSIKRTEIEKLETPVLEVVGVARQVVPKEQKVVVIAPSAPAVDKSEDEKQMERDAYNIAVMESLEEDERKKAARERWQSQESSAGVFGSFKNSGVFDRGLLSTIRDFCTNIRDGVQVEEKEINAFKQATSEVQELFSSYFSKDSSKYGVQNQENPEVSWINKQLMLDRISEQRVVSKGRG